VNTEQDEVHGMKAGKVMHIEKSGL